MSRRAFAVRLAYSGCLLALAALSGCSHPKQARLQAEDDTDRDKYEIKTVGDVTSVANARPQPLFGVGIVEGLDGTGGDCPPGPYRTLIEEELRKRDVKDVKARLASPNSAIVVLSAVIPPGSHKGDRIDVEVGLPPGSRAKSLRGGRLKECALFDYDTAKNLNPAYAGPDRMFKGHALARAEGAVVVGLGGANDESGSERHGYLWKGARTLRDSPFYLALNPDMQFARLASAIAARVNERFHGDQGGPATEMATAKTPSVVVLNVPFRYRHNLPRFLRVVRLIPLREGFEELQTNRLANGNASPAAAKANYRKRLEEDLLDPTRAVTAALRLESLGRDTISALKRGMQSDNVLVRFCAAESLAYLGSATCGEELARIVEDQPALRAYGLTALASLDEAVSPVVLRGLLGSRTAETRYGAFRALREQDDRDEDTAGELLAESYRLHRLSPESESLVHLTSARRAEVVLFGKEPRLVPPFSILAGEFTLTAGADDAETGRCWISRFSQRHGAQRKQSSLKVEDVLRAMSAMGGQYGEAVEMLRQAHGCKSLSCEVVVDALPQAPTVQQLAKRGVREATSEEQLRLAKADLGATPTLFEKKVPKADDLSGDAEALLDERQPAGKPTAQRQGRAGR